MWFIEGFNLTGFSPTNRTLEFQHELGAIFGAIRTENAAVDFASIDRRLAEATADEVAGAPGAPQGFK